MVCREPGRSCGPRGEAGQAIPRGQERGGRQGKDGAWPGDTATLDRTEGGVIEEVKLMEFL